MLRPRFLTWIATFPELHQERIVRPEGDENPLFSFCVLNSNLPIEKVQSCYLLAGCPCFLERILKQDKITNEKVTKREKKNNTRIRGASDWDRLVEEQYVRSDPWVVDISGNGLFRFSAAHFENHKLRSIVLPFSCSSSWNRSRSAGSRSKCSTELVAEDELLHSWAVLTPEGTYQRL